MSGPDDVERTQSLGVERTQSVGVERTQSLGVPPTRTRPIAAVAPPGAAPSDADPPGLLADQPTDQLPAPGPRLPTERFGPWQPLQPRVVPSRRSRTPYVIAALVLLVFLVGVLAVVLWG